MRKIDPNVLTRLVEDILVDSIKSSRLAEKVLEAINDMDSEVIAYHHYNFKCPGCGEHTYIEEVISDVVMTSIVTDISVVDEELLVDYGPVTTEGGCINTIRYQCSVCGYPVSESDMIKLVGK